MGWEQTQGDADHLAWERSDDYARVTVRETATGAWAITVDQLEQAADGPAYRRETTENREDAVTLATRWREEFDME